MAGLSTIRQDTLANKISFYHLLLLMASLPFDMFYSHLIVMSLIVHTMIQFKVNAGQKTAIPAFGDGSETGLFFPQETTIVSSVFSMRTAILASVFLITVCSTIYTSNRDAAFTDWGRQALILIFPVLFCFLRLDLKQYRAVLLLAFALVCSATVVFLYLYAAVTILYYGLPLSSIFSHAFTNHNFSAAIDIHATFFSMQLGLALVYLVSLLFTDLSKGYRFLFLVCILILSAGQIQLSSKSVCFCVFLSVNIVIPCFLWQRPGRRKYMVLTTGLSLMAVLLIIKPGTFRDRFIGQLHNDLSQAPAGEFGDPRLARWKVAAELILRKPDVGYGAGSEIPLLQNSFFEHRLYKSFLSRLNAHNQYLSFLIKSGAAGLLVYLSTLFWAFKTALSRRDLLFFIFILLVAFVSISENLLDVNKGIIFYAFFFSFFVFSAREKDLILFK